jgi:hypothetical protein
MGGNQLFAVVDKNGKKHYFDLKIVAKNFRDSDACAKKATVTWGPDHPNHHQNRSAPAWNKGKHPKKSWRGARGQQALQAKRGR